MYENFNGDTSQKPILLAEDNSNFKEPIKKKTFKNDIMSDDEFEPLVPTITSSAATGEMNSETSEVCLKLKYEADSDDIN
jgi:hypothetical protein